MENKKKTVLVTGSTRGIGRATALEFAKRGYNVVINGAHDREALKSLYDEITSTGAECLACFGDVKDGNEMSEMFSKINEKFGGADVVVNNAGISYIGLFQQMEPKEWENVLNTNVTGIYNICRCAIPLMIKEGRGKIINISSVWGNTGASCEVAYSASKGAVNALTKALAKELAPSNIQVNALACGAIDTKMNSFLDEDEKNMLLEEIPAGRMGAPSEVATMVAMLAEAPEYLTGQVITFDGGWQ